MKIKLVKENLINKALQAACKNGDVKMVKSLLARGADVHTRGEDSLKWAVYNEHVEIVKMLLDAGANVHIMDDLPLQQAVDRDNVEIVKLLLDAGANVHARNNAAYDLAELNDNKQMLELLKSYMSKLVNEVFELSKKEKQEKSKSEIKKLVKESSNESYTAEKLIRTAERDGYLQKYEGMAGYVISAALEIAEKWDALHPEEQKVFRDKYYKLFLKKIHKI